MATKESSTSSSKKTKKWTEEELTQILREKAQAYLRSPNITSVGVGYKIKGGKVTDELCIQFTVKRKLAPAGVEAERLTMLPERITTDDGTTVPVDVVQRSYQAGHELVSDPEAEAEKKKLPARKLRRKRLDPIMPGVSVSHPDGTAGTFGAVVYDNETGHPYILSNWHVLNGPTGNLGDVVVQPGPFDNSNASNNTCGRLIRSHLGLAGDCAIASIEGRGFKEDILELSISPKRVAKVNLGDKVVKSGRTTGVTYGVVTRVGVAVNIDYGGNVGVQQVGGFEIRPDPDHRPTQGEVSMGGDSGSLWLIHEDGQATDIAVGLHFAGETDPAPSEEHALACNIHSVLEKLNVAFVLEAEELLDNEEMINTMIDMLRNQGARLRELELRLAQAQGAALGVTVSGTADHGAPRPTVTPGAVGAERLGLPIYGNWCGPGHGGGTPVDDLDRACMQHDECYGRKGYFDCGCDKKLIQNIDTALSTGQVQPLGRALGPLIQQWFTIQPCVRRIFGIPIPAGTGGLSLFPEATGGRVKAVTQNGKTQWRVALR